MKVTPAYEYDVYNKLLKVPEVIEIYSLFEEYDIIAKIKAEDFEKLEEIVTDKIKSIKGVINIKTLMDKAAIMAHKTK